MTTKKNIYFDNLCRRVCELSVSSDCFKTASMEWTVTNYFEEQNQECCCGKKEICHIYSIANKFNANKIEYIGSKCITLFGNDELNDGMKTAKSIVNEKKKKMRKEQKQTELVKTYATQVLKTGKYTGVSFADVCKNHISYVKFLCSTPLKNIEFRNLCEFYKTTI